MSSIEYGDIFSSFLGNVTDYNFSQLNHFDLDDLLIEYLHKSISQPYIYSLFSDISLDDEMETIEYTMDYVISSSIDNEFVINVLGKAMVLEWIRPQVQSTLNIMQFVAGKEQKFYSQSNHLAELRNLKSDIEVDIRHLIMDRGYINNSYLDGTLS